jgi:hypothetical protein
MTNSCGLKERNTPPPEWVRRVRSIRGGSSMAHEKGPVYSSKIRLNFSRANRKTAMDHGTSPLSVGLENACSMVLKQQGT